MNASHSTKTTEINLLKGPNHNLTSQNHPHIYHPPKTSPGNEDVPSVVPPHHKQARLAKPKDAEGFETDQKLSHEDDFYSPRIYILYVRTRIRFAFYFALSIRRFHAPLRRRILLLQLFRNGNETTMLVHCCRPLNKSIFVRFIAAVASA